MYFDAGSCVTMGNPRSTIRTSSLMRKLPKIVTKDDNKNAATDIVREIIVIMGTWL